MMRLVEEQQPKAAVATVWTVAAQQCARPVEIRPSRHAVFAAMSARQALNHG